MIVTCRICGKKFEGRANACICSGACRLEANRQNAKKYRLLNPELYKQKQRDYWNRTHTKKEPVTKKSSEDPKKVTKLKSKHKDESKPKKHKEIAKDSEWAKKYAVADRLTKISMLSGALSKLEIAHLNYGQLSLIWLSEKYYKLLQQVLERAKEGDI